MDAVPATAPQGYPRISRRLFNSGLAPKLQFYTPISEYVDRLDNPLQDGLGPPDIHSLKIFEEGLHLDGNGGYLVLHIPPSGNHGFQIILSGP